MMLQFRLATVAISLGFGVLAAGAYAQILVDNTFNASDYTQGGAGPQQDVRFAFDYSSYDIFGDGFNTGSIPVAPRTTDGSRIGLFLSANNDTQQTLGQSLAAVVRNGLNVGTGTANPNYVVRFDMFHSTGVGIVTSPGPDGLFNTEDDEVNRTGTTNQALAGLNYSTGPVQIRETNASTTAGQGLGLAITADSGAFEDYYPIYGGAVYRNRGTAPPGDITDPFTLAGQEYGGPGIRTGLATEAIILGNLGPDPFDSPTAAQFTGDDGNPYFQDQFPAHSEPLHYVVDPTAAGFPGGQLAPNDHPSLRTGVPYNKWHTHEMFWVDGQFTYQIDGVPLVQFIPEAGTNVFDDFNTAGSVMFGFWDRFGGSVALSPEGSNFTIVDNLLVDTAAAGDVIDMVAFLTDEGYITGPGIVGDYNGDGQVNAADYTVWRDNLGAESLPNNRDPDNAGVVGQADYDSWVANFGNTAGSGSAAVVPEPTTVGLAITVLLGLLIGARKRAG